MVLFTAAGCSGKSSNTITIAVSTDIPPYVANNAKSGFEVDLLRVALPNHNLKFVQMSYDELESAVENHRADVSVGVLPGATDDENVFYSDEYMAFYNYAISKKSADLTITSVADLLGHRILAWEGAYLELGDEFKNLFLPQSPNRGQYREFANQNDQVDFFWMADKAIIVIDGSIFRRISRETGHSPDETAFHALFPPNRLFRVAFRTADVRDEFNATLKKLKENGEHQKLVKQYDVGPHEDEGE